MKNRGHRYLNECHRYARRGEEVASHMRSGRPRLGASAEEGEASVGDAAASVGDAPVMVAPRNIQLTKDEPCFKGNGLECKNTGTIVRVTGSEVMASPTGPGAAPIVNQSTSVPTQWLRTHAVYTCAPSPICAYYSSPISLLFLTICPPVFTLATYGKRLKLRAIIDLCELCDDGY